MFRFWADKQKFSDLLFGFIKNVQFDDKKNLVISGINQKTVLAEGEKIEKAYFQDKILLVSSHKNQNEDRLIALCSDSTSKFNKETEKENLDETKENIPKDENNLEKFEIFESSDNFTENEKILALSGAPSFRRRIDLAFYCYNSSSLNKKPLFGLSEASLDVFSASKLYFALTEQNLIVLRRKNSASVLQNLIRRNANDSAFRAFLNSFGEREACAICMALICGDNQLLELSEGYSLRVRNLPETDKSHAKSAYFSFFGGNPIPCNPDKKENDSVQRKQKEIEPKEIESKPMETDNIDNKEHFSSALKEKNFDLTETAYSRLIKFKESGRLSGLSTFTSRLLRPIWLYPVIVCKNLQAFSISGLAKNPEVVYSTKILQSILRPLKNVDEFLKKHKRIFYSVGAYNNYIDALKNRDFAKCHKIEVERVEGIHKIIVRTVEILTLFEHCSKSAISLQTIFGKIGKNQQQSLTQCSLAELVCTEKGETALRTLMIKMVEEKAAESEFFKDNCSSIFRIDDVLVCSAQNTLKKAANFYPNAALFEKELEKADKELIAAAEMTGREFPFDNVIAKMNEARNFPGIVKLCLRLAKIIKTNEKIQKVASDRLTESKCFEKALSAFDEAINLYKNENSLNSKNVHFSLFQRQLEFMRKEVVLDGNKTFLRKLFLMLIEKKNNLYLFRFRSDCEFLSEFLEEECSNNLEIANVALALYLENKQFFKAASLARYWSVMKEGVDFERRLELISKSQRYFLSIERPSQKEQSFNLASRQYQIRISLQKKLIEALNLSSESSERVAKQVLPIKQLYNEARSSKVYEICLELHRHNFLEDVGGRLLAKFWQFVVLSELQMALNSMDWKNSLRLSISPLIKLASKNCDPRFDALALCLEKANNEHSKTIGKWITDTFLENGVEAPFLAKTYQKVVDIAINSGFAQNFKANCQITVSIASVIEAICRYSEKLDRNEKKNVLEIGSKLAEIWKGQRIKASNDLQMRARKHVNQSFFAACLKINQAVASSWNK